jgi:hypothetical protein
MLTYVYPLAWFSLFLIHAGIGGFGMFDNLGILMGILALDYYIGFVNKATLLS